MEAKFDGSNLLIRLTPRDNDYDRLAKQLRTIHPNGYTPDVNLSVSHMGDADTYPRDKANRFVPKLDLAKAARDDAHYTKLRESLPESDHHKLDSIISHLQMGGVISHPKENPGLAVDLEGKIANHQWAEYADKLGRRQEWEKRDGVRGERRDAAHDLTRDLRRAKAPTRLSNAIASTTSEDDLSLKGAKGAVADELSEYISHLKNARKELERTGASSIELRKLDRLIHQFNRATGKRGDAREFVDSLRDALDAVEKEIEEILEAIHSRIDKDSEDDLEPESPKEPEDAAFGMVGDEWHGPTPPGPDWLPTQPGPRGGKRWRRGGTAGAKQPIGRARPDQRGGGAENGAVPPPDSSRVEGSAEPTDHAITPESRQDQTQPIGPGPVTSPSTTTSLSPAGIISTTAATRRIAGYANHFRAKRMEQMADLMDMVKDHIRKVGADKAAKILGTETEESANYQKLQYQTTGQLDEKDQDIKFMRKYLEESGIKLQTVGTPDNYDPSLKLVTGAPIPEAHERQRGGDIVPLSSGLEDKLQESKFIPGLESSEDVDLLVGHHVTQITPDVASKFDEVYGNGKWIIKSYGDESYAGYGIFFPERLKSIQKEHKEDLWDATRELKKRGYGVVRNESNDIIGVSDRQGNVLHFGTDEPDMIQDFEARKQTRRLYVASRYEKGARLPLTPEDSIEQDYGLRLVKDASGKRVTGIIGRDGKTYDLDQDEYLKNNKTSKQLEEHIDDVAWGGVGIWKDIERAIIAVTSPSQIRFMVQPAFQAVGVSQRDRGLGLTWESSTEGRVHVVVDKDGNAKVVPYATLASRDDALPVVFTNKNILAMEKAAQEAVDALPHHLRQNRVFAPDVMKTKDGWRVVEMNTSAEEGSSGWLEENQFVIDAYVAAVTGRDPQHVNFIRRILREGGAEAQQASGKAARMKARHGAKAGAKIGKFMSNDDQAIDWRHTETMPEDYYMSIGGPPIERIWNYTPQSSWVHSFKQRQDRQHNQYLVVRFKNPQGRITASCHYEDESGALYRGIEEAISKGKYVNQSLYHLDYDLGRKFAMGHGHAEDQPRVPAGSAEGGQFTTKGKSHEGGATRRVKLGRLKVEYGTYRNITNRINGPRINLDNYKQEDSHSCGFLAALTVARYYNLEKTSTQVLDATRASVNYGCDRTTMRAGLKKLGISGRHQLGMTVDSLKRYVKRGIPVIVSLYGEDWFSDHWVIVQGFDEKKKRIYLTNYGSIPIKEFRQLWSDMDTGEKGEVIGRGREGIVCIPEGEDAATYKYEGKALAVEFDESKVKRDKIGRFSKKHERATSRAHEATENAWMGHGEGRWAKDLEKLTIKSADIERHETPELRGATHKEVAESHKDFMEWHGRQEPNEHHKAMIRLHEKAHKAHSEAAKAYGVETKPEPTPIPEEKPTPPPPPPAPKPEIPPEVQEIIPEPKPEEPPIPQEVVTEEEVTPEPEIHKPEPTPIPMTPRKAGVSLKAVEGRAFTGKPMQTTTRLSKVETRRLGEDIVTAYLHMQGKEDARPLNYGHNDFPIDLVHDHETIEVKTGLVSNAAKSQHWRSTIGTPGKAESRLLSTMTPEERRQWNRSKQAAIVKRKEAALKAVGEELGKEVKAKTYTLVINPDTKTADIYEFEGLHERIGWNSPEAKKGYRKTVQYEDIGEPTPLSPEKASPGSLERMLGWFMGDE